MIRICKIAEFQASPWYPGCEAACQQGAAAWNDSANEVTPWCLLGEGSRAEDSTWVEGAELLAQQARQHGNDSVNKVYAGPPLASLRVQHAASCHKVRHVSDVHAYAEGPPGQRLY